MVLCLGEMVWIGSEDPRLFNRQFIYMVRVANVKMPRLLAFARHAEAETVKVQKPMSITLNGEPGTAIYNKYFEKFGEGTHLAMLKTICAPDSSSLKPGSGATEGVRDEGVLG